MSRDIHEGRWVQLRGRIKRAWGRLIGNDAVAAEGNAEVITGALQESLGMARRVAAREVARGVDRVASFAKRAARSLAR
jgi:uncharacterized protein YjbJ (UPF0337 family)